MSSDCARAGSSAVAARADALGRALAGAREEEFGKGSDLLKVRFIEPANLPYRRSPKNLYVYDKYIRTPSQGVLTLATIVAKTGCDVLAYSESLSKIVWSDVLDADIVFVSIFTFNANRGYELADRIRNSSDALVVIGGLHATLAPREAASHADYVLRGEGDESIIDLVGAVMRGEKPDVAGLAFLEEGELVCADAPKPPHHIDTVPDRSLLYRFKEMAGHNTIWPQVHASRGCPHACDYCSPVAAFGRGVRVRTPAAVVEDIRQAIDFFDNGHHRIAKMLWITDDNFFADRAWAMRVLNAIIESGIRYNFTIQARFEVGFDDGMLDLLAKAGFCELAMGIEFLEDEAFDAYHKRSTAAEIRRAVRNIQKHGLCVRGLFIVGADNHTPGVGKRIAQFVEDYDLCGALIQSMYFVPDTPVYETHKDLLIDGEDWSRCVGKVVHRPKNMSARELQQEIIVASKTIYSRRRLMRAVLRRRGVERVLFIGEYFWQKEVRRELARDLRERLS